MSIVLPDSAVLWMTNVTVARPEIEAALAVRLSDYFPGVTETSFSAKYALPLGDGWSDVSQFVNCRGEALAQLVASGAIGSAALDVAFMFPAENISRSVEIPARIAASIGGYSIRLVISTYSAASD